MKILIVCGAGASSTFLAQRINAAARRQGREISASAGTEATLETLGSMVDIVLVGPHLAADFDRLRDWASAHGASAYLLSTADAADREGEMLLSLATSIHDAGASASLPE